MADPTCLDCGTGAYLAQHGKGYLCSICATVRLEAAEAELAAARAALAKFPCQKFGRGYKGNCGECAPCVAAREVK